MTSLQSGYVSCLYAGGELGSLLLTSSLQIYSITISVHIEVLANLRRDNTKLQNSDNEDCI